MSRRTFVKLGITDPALASAYRACRQLNARHGKTYYLATLLLPPPRRPFVHALYGLARYADDIVDSMTDRPISQREAALLDLRNSFLRDLQQGRSDHPIAAAAVDTAIRFDIPREHFDAFFHSMTMDLSITRYETFADLREYTYGSAAVIGLQMVPILGGRSAAAYTHAEQLGTAFQLANFIRDVGEDLQRGRIYLPLQELSEFGVSEQDLLRRQLTPGIQAALAFQIERVRQLQRDAAAGVDYLDPQCRPCIRTASTLYCGIVDEVERNGYDVFTKRATVPLRTRLAVAIPAWSQARRARHGRALHPDASPENP